MKYILLIIFALVLSNAYAQNEVDPNTLTLAGAEQESVFTSFSLDEVALIDLESVSGNLDIDFLFSADNIEAGESIIPSGGVTNNEIWLNYTSAVPVNQTRNIGVNIDADLPTGITLSVEASSYSGTGSGAHGVPNVLPIVLSTTSQTIVSQIGGAFTGDGAANGHNLNYILEITDTSGIPTSGLAVEITYTMSSAF